MSCLHFGIRGAAIRNMLIVEDAERCEGNLIDFPGETADSRPSCELVKASHAILLGGKSNKHRLHGSLSFCLEISKGRCGQQDEGVASNGYARVVRGTARCQRHFPCWALPKDEPKCEARFLTQAFTGANGFDRIASGTGRRQRRPKRWTHAGPARRGYPG